MIDIWIVVLSIEGIIIIIILDSIIVLIIILINSYRAGKVWDLL